MPRIEIFVHTARRVSAGSAMAAIPTPDLRRRFSGVPRGKLPDEPLTACGSHARRTRSHRIRDVIY
jgi:hypothetical protein